MHIEVRTRGVPLPVALRARAERRVSFALDRVKERIARVEVRFDDVNGPRGGEDKTCVVAVSLRGAGTVRVTERRADAFTALDLAVHRAARAVARALERERDLLVELLALTAAVSGGDPDAARARRRDALHPRRRAA